MPNQSSLTGKPFELPAKNYALIKIHIQLQFRPDINHKKHATIQILTDFTGIFKSKTEQFRKALELFSTANTYMTPCLSSQLSMNSIRESLITINVETKKSIVNEMRTKV